MANMLPMAQAQGVMMPSAMPIQQPKRGLGTKLKEGIFGGPGQIVHSPLLSPQQQQLQGANIQNVLQMLQGGANAPSKFDFGAIKREAQNRFQTETLPSIAERFASLGDAQGSSGYLSTLGRAGADLDRGLASLEAQFGQQQQQQDRDYLIQLLRFALAPQFESSYIPGKSGLLGGAGAGLGQGIGAAGPLMALKYLGIF